MSQNRKLLLAPLGTNTARPRLSPYRDALLELWEKSTQPNPFFHPDLLVAALESGLVGQPIELWFTMDGPEMVACLPITRAPLAQAFSRSQNGVQGWFHRKLRIPCLLTHPHCFLSSPIYSSSAALFDLIARLVNRSVIPGLVVPAVSDRCPFLQELQTAAPLTLMHFGEYERAACNTKEGTESWHSKQQKKQEKENRRKLQQLDQAGRVALKEQELATFAQDYIELEHLGWKGAAQTSLISLPNEERFFRAVLSPEISSTLDIKTKVLKLDEKIIASTCSLMHQNVAFRYKTTFAEEYSQFSPGAILERYEISDLLNVAERIDSCASHDATLMNRTYPDRLKISSIVITSKKSLRGVALSKALKLLAGTKKQPSDQ